MRKRLMLVAAALAALTAPGVAHADAVTQVNLNASTAFMVTAAQGRGCRSRTWRWCTAPSTTPSTRSTAATRAIC